MEVANWNLSNNILYDNVSASLIRQMVLDKQDHENGRSELEENFQKLIETDNKIIAELIDLLICIYEHQKSVRIVKSAGTSVGALGALSMVAGLCMAPATGGSSAILSLGGLVATGEFAKNGQNNMILKITIFDNLKNWSF